MVGNLRRSRRLDDLEEILLILLRPHRVDQLHPEEARLHLGSAVPRVDALETER